MRIDQEVNRLVDQASVVLAATMPQADPLPKQFGALLAPSVQITLQSLLDQAANDLNDQLRGTAEFRVEIREGEPILSGRGLPTDAGPASSNADAQMPGDFDTDTTTRFTLRIPESLKLQAEQVASRSGLSLNMWIVQTIAAAMNTSPSRTARSLRGWMS